MLDLIIRGGDIVSPQGMLRSDVAIKGENFAAVFAPDALAGVEAKRIFDAACKIAMPGGIYPHVHTSHPSGRTMAATHRIVRRMCPTSALSADSNCCKTVK
jgi:dihydroorotase-like cyclic amidohydrolase